MKRFIEGESRNQSTLFPESLDDYVREDNPVQRMESAEKLHRSILSNKLRKIA
jgi:hypothetical protein